MRGDLDTLQRAIDSGEIATIAKYVSVGFACNVFYASVMKASSRQYTAQFDELAGESASVDHLLTTSQGR
jgi:hypothetical protein